MIHTVIYVRAFQVSASSGLSSCDAHAVASNLHPFYYEHVERVVFLVRL